MSGLPQAVLYQNEPRMLRYTIEPEQSQDAILDEGREREAKAMIETPELEELRPIYENGFLDGVPPKVKLWDLEPAKPDGLEPAERRASIHRDFAWLSQGNHALNAEQVSALEKAFDAPGGLSLILGKPRSGKTSVGVIEALIAAWSGYRVLVCSPNEEDNQDIGNVFRTLLSALPKGRSCKVYWTIRGPQWTAPSAKLERAYIRKCRHIKPPMLTGYGMVKLIKADIETLKTPEYQEKLKNRFENYAKLEPLLESRELWSMWKKIEDDAPLMEISRFNELYRKVYARVIADADILITCCDRIGVEDIYPFFKPTVVLIDNCNLASVPEAWIPLLTYNGTRIRTLIGGDRSASAKVTDSSKPETACEGSLIELLASRGVPVHELQTQYSIVTLDQRTDAGANGQGGQAAMQDV